nr:DNA topoisomerase [Candidatus Sigynarchaeota archaeon]
MDNGSRKSSSSAFGTFYFASTYQNKKYIVFSTNGHLQVFQNSSIYKWSGIDPRKIIEDENSVIPVLNSFNKKNYYSLQKLVSENIGEIVLAITPDVNALTIGLKEIGNLLQKSKHDRSLKKLILYSLEPRDIIEGLNRPEPISLDDEKCSEIEYLRSFLDAIISFSITQEITYTIKRCIDNNSPAFKELKETLKHDLKESKNLLIPMSRAQALILMWIFENNKLIGKSSNELDNAPHEIFIKICAPNGMNVDFKVNDVVFPNFTEANAYIQKIKEEKHVRIENVSSKDLSLFPPFMYDLTGLIDQVSEEFGFPTTYTYKILIDMYYFKLITYPNPERGNGTRIHIDHEQLIKQLSEIDEFEDLGKKAIENFRGMTEAEIRDVVARSKNSIFPISIQSKNSPFFKSRANHWKIYASLVRRYLLQFFKPAIISETKISLNTKNAGVLTISSYKIKSDGFTQFQKESILTEFKSLEFDVLKSLEIAESYAKSTQKPRAFYTDASLLKEIKGKNLGDTVSYLLMIEKLIANNYIQVINKNLKLTKRGELIAEFLNETFDFLGGLEFTRFFIGKMQELDAINDLAAFKSSLAEMKKQILDEYLARFSKSRERTNDYLLKQGVNLAQTADKAYDAEQKKRFSTAPEIHLFCSCGSPMKVIETKTKTRFLACENRLGCGKTAALPREGKITVVDKNCAICG